MLRPRTPRRGGTILALAVPLLMNTRLGRRFARLPVWQRGLITGGIGLVVARIGRVKRTAEATP